MPRSSSLDQDTDRYEREADTVVVTISNLGTSGLDVTSIVSSLMSIASEPQTLLQNQLSNVTSEQSAWQTIQTQLTGLLTAATALDTPATAAGAVATSTNTSVLTATATSNATANAGSVSFTVDQLATASQIASGGFSSTNSLVGAGTFAVAAGLGSLGLSGLDATAATAGAHTIAVTTGSAGASVAGSAVTVPVTLTGANNTFTLDTGSGAQTVSVAAGTYSSLTDLATAVQNAAGSGVTVGVNGGALTFSTTNEGSSATLTVGANAALGLAGGTAAGTDAVVSIDGTATTVSNLDGTGQVSANGITLNVGTHLSAGSSSVAVVQTDATTTLSGLASAITAAGGPATASAIDTGSGNSSAHLVLGSTQTGLIGALSISSSGITGFDAADTQTLTAASDAVLHMGSLEVTRSSNTVNDVIPGVTLQLNAVSSTPVTVAVGPDSSGTSTKVNALVSSLNSVLTTLNTDTAYNVASSTGGPLFGDGAATDTISALQNALIGSPTSALSQQLNKIGFHVDSGGTYSVDPAVLSAALASDPTGTAAAIAGIATTIASASTQLTQTNGIVATAISSYATQASTLTDEISDWQTRLNDMQTNYTTQYANLSAAVDALHQQGTALAGIISGLPTWNTGSSSSS
jgi:flagellar hook-associated protein 2